MTSSRKVLESGRKRARTEEASCSSSSGALAVLACNKTIGLTSKAFSSTTLRASLMSGKLSALLKDFPEMKFIIDFENLQTITEAAVVKYDAEEKDAMIHEAQVLMNYGKEISPLYALPDEVQNKCLSYVGKGHYGSIGLVSKKLNQAYIEDFGRETAYLEIATSMNLANYCLSNLCKSLEEKDEILKAAAVNGNLDILRAAVKDGYDLFPLVAMNNEAIYTGNNSHYHLYYIDDDQRQRPPTVNLAKLVERGHLHVLKYLHEELHYFLGLQRYCKPAIEHGKLEILQWLDDIDCLENGGLRIGEMDNGKLKLDFDFCECAIKSGHVEILDWLLETGSYSCINNRTSDKYVLAEAIESKSIEMIQYCFNLGCDNLNNGWVEYAMKKTKSVKVFRKMGMWMWIERDRIEEYFEVIKFLRSIAVPWDQDIMNDILENYCSLEIIQYAHEHGCPWTGKELGILLKRSRMSQSWSMDKFNYLIDNGCTITHEQSSGLIYEIKAKRDIEVLKYFVGKNSNFDNKLYKEIFEYGELWSEGLSYLLKKGKDIQIFKSIEEVFRHRKFSMERIRYFYDLGLPWCVESSRNTHLLSRIACCNDLDHVKWAFENGCKGGKLVQYVQEEWKERGIRHEQKWKENQAFFEENGLLDECFLEKNWVKKLDPKNVQEIGDAQLSLYFSRESSFFRLDFCSLEKLADYGYKFLSESEQEKVCKIAYMNCCQGNKNYRKRLAVLVGMGVRNL